MAGVDTERIMRIGLELAGWKKAPADSAVHVRGKDIKKVMIAIDVGTAELLLARNLGCDAVIAHHPIGVASVNSHADIYSDVVGAAKAIKMPLVNIHQPCDEYMRQVILKAIKSGKTEYVTDIVKSVSRIPEFRKATTKVRVRFGSESNRAGHWALVVAAGTNGGFPIAKAYFEHGVTTVIYLHVDYGDLTKLREEKIEGNLVVLGHLAGDSVGLNGLADRLEEIGVETVRIGILQGSK
jgi:putative NIF3 family GTP cyclohydrolase 1 type 2